MLSSLHTKIKLALFLVPALAAVVFLVWWFHPTRVIERRLDTLLGTVEVSLLRTGSSDQLENVLNTLLADAVEFVVPAPIPAGPRTVADVAGSITRLHESVTSCRIQHTEPSIQFPVSGESRVTTTLRADLSVGSGTKTTRRYMAKILYKKGAGGWKVHRIALKEL